MFNQEKIHFQTYFPFGTNEQQTIQGYIDTCIWASESITIVETYVKMLSKSITEFIERFDTDLMRDDEKSI